jgi:WhiB family redox-sensing transcriptional regulator
MKPHWGSRAGSGSIMNAEGVGRARAVLAREIATGPNLSGATCSTTDPEIWYPEKGRVDQARLAAKLCRECPVRRKCLEYALNSEPSLTHYGVWGGYAAKRLSRMRMLRKALRRSTCHPPKQGVASAETPTPEGDTDEHREAA